MMTGNNLPSYEELVKKRVFTPREPGKIESFVGVEGKDVYNPSVVFSGGKKYLAARVESRNSYWLDEKSYDPQVIFFEEVENNIWKPVSGTMIFDKREDPFSAWIRDDKGEKVLIFGVVSVDFCYKEPVISTEFYKGKDIFSLEEEPFAVIQGMKDIRLVESSDGQRKYVFLRPQGNEYGLGKIGVSEIFALEELNALTLENMIVLHQADENVRLGSNEVYLFRYGDKDLFCVLGHIASHDASGSLHYAAVVFFVDPDALIKVHQPQVVATRSDFPEDEVKVDILQDVVFPGSFEFLPEGDAYLYAGLSDARVGKLFVDRAVFNNLKYVGSF